MTTDSIPCDIVLLPKTDLANKAIAASKSLAQLDSLFTLEDGKYYPHSSLYMLQLSDGKLEQVKELLAGIAQSANAIQLKADGYYQKEGYIDVGYDISDKLRSLQEKVLVAINPLRDGMREKDKARMLEATGVALDNFKNYGYKYVGELFRPHITFTRLSQEQVDVEKLLPDLSVFDGTFTRIGLFEMGDNGTCVRKIAEFDLQQEAENGE